MPFFHNAAWAAGAFVLDGNIKLATSRGGTDIEAAVAALSADPNIEAASPDLRVFTTATPTDPLFPDNWGHNNTGQSNITCVGYGESVTDSLAYLCYSIFVLILELTCLDNVNQWILWKWLIMCICICNWIIIRILTSNCS